MARSILSRSGKHRISIVRLGAGGGGVASNDSIEIATEFYRPMPQPHETWSPTYTDNFSHSMAPKEIIPLWFRVRTGSAKTLALGGTDASKFTATFFKPFGQVVDDSSAFKRASLSASPTGTYYDPLNPIATGASNFTPEVADAYEYIYCALKCNSGTSGNQTCSITFTLGDDSVTCSMRVWGNFTIPDNPSVPILVAAPGSFANGAIGGYTDDTTQCTITSNIADLLINYRVTPYQTPLTFLATTGSPTVFNVDQFSGNGGSFRQLILNKVPSGGIKFWMCDPSGNATHRSLAYAQAAERTITAEGLSNMYVYIWDEPAAGSAATVKAALDAWSAGSPSTKMFLTANLDYDNGNPSGLNFGDYSNLVLSPVINQIGGAFPGVSSYTDARLSYYSSCQGNCGTRLNTNTTAGTDTGYVDHAYIDYPMYRRYGAVLLAKHSSWIAKVAATLYYNSIESWTDFSSNTAPNRADATKNPWLSARRFKIMGDGTLIYPAIPSYQPHTGISAFAAGSKTGVPSIRLLYLAHASFMAEYFERYRTLTGTNSISDVLTNATTFSTTYLDYHNKRAALGAAIEAA